MISTDNSEQALPLRAIRWSFRNFRGILFLLYLCAPQVNLLALYFTNTDRLAFVFCYVPDILISFSDVALMSHKGGTCRRSHSVGKTVIFFSWGDR